MIIRRDPRRGVDRFAVVIQTKALKGRELQRDDAVEFLAGAGDELLLEAGAHHRPPLLLAVSRIVAFFAGVLRLQGVLAVAVADQQRAQLLLQGEVLLFQLRHLRRHVAAVQHGAHRRCAAGRDRLLQFTGARVARIDLAAARVRLLFGGKAPLGELVRRTFINAAAVSHILPQSIKSSVSIFSRSLMS